MKVQGNVDREYVLAGYASLLIHGHQTAAFIAKRAVTKSEQKRAAMTVCQLFMQGCPAGRGMEAVRRVTGLEYDHDISSEELVRLADEVFRGTYDPDQSRNVEAEKIRRHVVLYFICNVPKEWAGPMFSYTGILDAFQPTDGRIDADGIVSDLIYRDCTVDWSALPSELQELARDVGIIP